MAGSAAGLRPGPPFEHPSVEGLRAGSLQQRTTQDRLDGGIATRAVRRSERLKDAVAVDLLAVSGRPVRNAVPFAVVLSAGPREGRRTSGPVPGQLDNSRYRSPCLRAQSSHENVAARASPRVLKSCRAADDVAIASIAAAIAPTSYGSTRIAASPATSGIDPPVVLR